MNAGLLKKWSLLLSLACLPVAGGCQPKPNSSSSVQAAAVSPSAPTPVVEAVSAPSSAPSTNQSPVASGQPTAPEISNAQVEPVQTQKPVPPSVRNWGPVSEVIKLVNSGVDESVLLAFVTNSTSTFNLSAEDIIYLNDIGVSGSVVTAMLQRDQTIRATSVAATTSLEVPPQPTQSPQDVAPQAIETPSAPPSAPPPAAEPYAVFYDSLSPYGTWVNVDGYGLCWQPTVVVANPGWQPYLHCGRWVYADCGWYWSSDYSWGWAPFHYGRWFQHNQLGWCWAPDTVWGPSWVCWRYSNAYCGWAPLPPAACYHPGVGFTYYGSSAGFAFDFGLSWSSYSFVGWQNFNSHHLYGCAVPPHQVNQIYNNTVVVNKIVNNQTTIINQGIPPDQVAAHSGTPVQRVALRETHYALGLGDRGERFDSRGSTLTVYRPSLPQSSRTASSVIDRSGAVRRSSTPVVGAPVPAPARQNASLRLAEASRPERPQPAPLRVAPTQAVASAAIANPQSHSTHNAVSLPRTVVSSSASIGNRSQPAPLPSLNRPSSSSFASAPGQPGTSATPQPVRLSPSVPRMSDRSSGSDRSSVATHSEVSSPTPWLVNRAATPAVATVPTTPALTKPVPTPAYQPQVHTAPAAVPRYYSPPAPAYAPQRAIAIPETRNVPVANTYSPPSRPSVPEPQRYAVPVTGSRAAETRPVPAPQTPASPSVSAPTQGGRNQR